ncbi:reticulon-like protein B21 [Vigna radiata var. radiata]|uniref:Reticulon-like protein n=1 Tax=Vigna radiata var. radiata TaxID=3916 RepID=A0A1S3U3Q3_VIGRR|nr:reticulon-like protein B21 [Vigna radiata var. radiata]
MNMSRRVGARCSVVAGSVWESRMKRDEVGGGVKVFRAEQGSEEGGNVGTRLKSSQTGGVVATGKRKSLKLETKKIQIGRGKVQQCKNLNVSSDSIKKSPKQVRKEKNEGIGASVCTDKLERGPILTRKKISEVGESGKRNIGQLRKNNDKNDSDENCKDFGVCQEKIISSSSDDASMVNVDGDSHDDDEEEDEEEVEMNDEEFDIEMEIQSFDVKEINAPESKVVNKPEKELMNVPEKQKTEKAVRTDRHFHQKHERLMSVPLTVKPSPPIKKLSTIHQNFSKGDSIPKAEECYSFPQSQTKLQSLVDLIMWKDISRSAFVFGIGTFTIVSSSYAKDINLSLISAMSYLGLIYLAVIFLHRSLICRGVIDVESTNYVLGEEEAITVLKLILPYLNEFLSQLRTMFSGDPGTTIKLAISFFVLARCGSSITIWNMAKFCFFGSFTLPRICSSYSAQLTTFANFWIGRFRDAWDSCSHKKVVALAIFCLAWNLSSLVARIWSVFVLFVGFKYYQQHYLVRDERVEDEGGFGETWHEPVVVKARMQRQLHAPNLFDTKCKRRILKIV